MEFGLKLWSINENYIEPALSLYEQGLYHFIELFVVPGSASYIEKWHVLPIPFILHAPHSLAGFNPAITARKDANFALLPELDEYRSAVNPEFIVFHPGVDGSLEETIIQFIELRERYPKIHAVSIVENKPKIGLTGTFCMGASPDEIARIQQKADMGFCFDIGHAICAANTSGIPPQDLFRDFMDLEPELFHLSDGNAESEYDSHLNFGKGTFNISTIVKQLPNDAKVTIETDKSSKGNLDDFAADAEFLEKIINS